MCRLLAKDDVFAVPSGSAADSDSIIRSLYLMPPASPAASDLIHFRVDCLEPDCGTSCAIDFNRTQVMLEV